MQNSIMEGYKSGINLGGWISQCDLKSEHIAGFIAKEDIAKIASWGLDHVRLPFDYPVLEEGRNGFAVIDSLIDWCKEYGLNVILDMHHAPGYAFHNKDERLFTEDEMKANFVSIWETFTKRYINEGNNIIFELMNEITDPHGDTWNKIARMAIERILSIDPDRYILLGGPYHNTVEGLDTLEIWDNEHILYNFHFYEPLLFTHQRASWTPLKDINIVQPYPGKIEGIAYLRAYNPGSETDKAYARNMYDRDFILAKLAPAFDFIKRTGKKLYCGEYGAIDNADLDSRINYIRDISSIFGEHNIGKACWTYKGMGFTSIDDQGNPLSDALISAIAAH